MKKRDMMVYFGLAKKILIVKLLIVLNLFTKNSGNVRILFITFKLVMFSFCAPKLVVAEIEACVIFQDAFSSCI